MLIYLVPVFQTFVPDGTPIPGITRLIFNMSASVRSNWLIWLLSVGAVVTAVMALFKSDLGKNAWERVKLNIPIFGKLIQKTVIARFSRTLATLLAGGIPVVQALQSAGPTSGSLLLSNAVEESTRRIEEGRNISTPLEESGLFPPMVTQMIAVGEETGQLSELLDQIASFMKRKLSYDKRAIFINRTPNAYVGWRGCGWDVNFIILAYFYIYYCFILMVIKELENCYGYF